MSYSAAIFFLDPESGNDLPRTVLTGCVLSNPSGSITRVTKTAHGLVDNAVVDLSDFTGNYNDAWIIDYVDANNFDLVGMVWVGGADLNGTVTPRGGSSIADAWKTPGQGASSARHQSGDTIRMKMTLGPSSLGNGSWTGNAKEDQVSITSSTNATPIVITRASHGLTTNDVVAINSHATNSRANGVHKVTVIDANTFSLQTLLGANSVGNGVGSGGYFRRINNQVVKLATSPILNVANHGNQATLTNWTASANVTSSVDTTNFKQGGEAIQLAIASGFTTGLIAYVPTGSALNLSGYQQISFLIMQTAGNLAIATDLEFRTYSDAAGATPQDTLAFSLGVEGSFGALNQWMRITLNKGSALYNGVQSVGLHAVADNGAQTFVIDHVIASKAASSADALSLTSLIGKNVANDTFCSISSIIGDYVLLDMHVNSRPSTSTETAVPRGYAGTTETVTTYKREAARPANMGASLYAMPLDFYFSRTGVEAGRITYSGGWDRTSMTSRDGETWLDGVNGMGAGFGGVRGFLDISDLSAVRFSQGMYWTLGHRVNFSGAVHLNNNSINGYYPNQGVAMNGALASLSYNLEGGIAQYVPADNSTLVIGIANGNGYWGITGHGRYNDITFTQAWNNGTYGLVADWSSGEVVFRSGTCKWNGLASVQNGLGSGFNSPGENFLKGVTLLDSTEVLSGTYNKNYLWSENHDGVAGAKYLFQDGGFAKYIDGILAMPNAGAWRIDITATTISTAFPWIFPRLMVLPVNANALVTVTCRALRSSNSIFGRLVCKGGQIAGVTADVTDSLSLIPGTSATMTRVGTLATATVTSHGFSNGDYVRISGAAQAQYNGSFLISNVTANTFDYTMASDPGASGSGTAEKWEVLSISFTPTEAGTVDISFEAYGGTTQYVAVGGPMTATQAA